MLKPAQLYKEELNKLYINTWYDSKYQYYHSSPSTNELLIPDNNNIHRTFACVDKDDNIIGYFSYRIDWQSRSVYNFGLITFTNGSTLFIRNVLEHVKDLFINHNINRLEWWAYADNPAIKGYDKLVKRYGGARVGHLHNTGMLADGKLHDTYIYEILRENVNFLDKR